LAGDNVGNISPGWASPELKATDATAPDWPARRPQLTSTASQHPLFSRRLSG
jgi:hypothetical protein